jgi:hypothetical protein
MSGFSETQLQVREAVGKICEDFPDVSVHALISLIIFCPFVSQSGGGFGWWRLVKKIGK